MRVMNHFFHQLLSGRLSNPADFFEALRLQRIKQKGKDTTMDRFFQTLDTSGNFTAPERLKVGASVFTGEMYLRQQNRANWQFTDVQIRLFAARLVEVARRKGIPLYVHSAFRTKKEQNALVAKGVSKATWPRAPHSQGKAVDIVHSLYHWDLTDDEWQLLGKIGKQIAGQLGLNITWGGDWRFYDPAHWELSDWRDTMHVSPPISGERIHKTARKLLEETKGFK